MAKKTKHSEIEDIDMSTLFNSKEFKEAFAKQVEKDTWGKGLPKVYMNDKGEIVRHWKNGKIEIIKKAKK